ncbi:glycosyltransferase family A protein [Alteromonas sediminis]
MFAYNEEANIKTSIESVYKNTDAKLNRYLILANGCTDATVQIAEECKKTLEFAKLEVVEIELGDKCNAWNTYVHDLSDEVDTHFFCDSDINFSDDCFSKMSSKLEQSQPETMIIAGMPLSGRNIAFYRSLIIERACFFGNLYGMRSSFIKRIRSAGFRLPVGLNWIDSFLTKAVNTDLEFFDHNLPNRTTWIEGVGYKFESLSITKKSDINLYINRIARYELGKLQEVILDSTPVKDWPRDLNSINQTIWKEFNKRSKHLGFVKKYLVKKRLKKLLDKG